MRFVLPLFAAFFLISAAGGEERPLNILPFARQVQMLEEDLDTQMRDIRPLLDELEHRSAIYAVSSDPAASFTGRRELREKVRRMRDRLLEIEQNYRAYEREYAAQQTMAWVRRIVKGERVGSDGGAVRNILSDKRINRDSLRYFKIRVDEALEDEERAYDAARRIIKSRRARRRALILAAGVLLIAGSVLLALRRRRAAAGKTA